MNDDPGAVKSAAERVIEKCGGVERTAKFAGVSPSWVRRWEYPAERGGAAGTVPTKAARALSAQIHNVPGLTLADILGLPPAPGE